MPDPRRPLPSSCPTFSGIFFPIIPGLSGDPVGPVAGREESPLGGAPRSAQPPETAYSGGGAKIGQLHIGPPETVLLLLFFEPRPNRQSISDIYHKRCDSGTIRSINSQGRRMNYLSWSEVVVEYDFVP